MLLLLRSLYKYNIEGIEINMYRYVGICTDMRMISLGNDREEGRGRRRGLMAGWTGGGKEQRGHRDSSQAQ